MFKRSVCPICGDRPKDRQLCAISPWIRELTGVERRLGIVYKCESCSFEWFAYAYDVREMDSIYGNYREQRYVDVRNKWEPWYTKEWNVALSDDSTAVRARLDSTRAFLEPFLGKRVGTVVDVGGDRGQFIPLGEDRIVVDVSSRNLCAGVRRARVLAEVLPCNLLISAHLLEHVSDPVAILETYSGAEYIYLEVPAGAPSLSWERSIASVGAAISGLRTNLWRRHAKPSAGRSRSRRFEPIRQSEHLNFFSERSLVRLVERSGRSCLGVETSPIPTPDGAPASCVRLVAR